MKDTDDVKTAGFESTSNTYKAAELMFSQDPRPQSIAVMGLATKDGVSRQFRNL